MAARLVAIADHGGDELRVLDGILVRLELGLDRYGPLDLSVDRRDFQREGDEEIADWAVYRACKRVSDRDTQIAAIEEGLDELVDNTPTDDADAINVRLRYWANHDRPIEASIGPLDFDLSDEGGDR